MTLRPVWFRAPRARELEAKADLIVRQYAAPEQDLDALGAAWVALSGGDEPAAEQHFPSPGARGRVPTLEEERGADVERLGAAWEQWSQ